MVSPFDAAWALLKNWEPTEEEIRQMEQARLAQMRGKGGAGGPMHSHIEEETPSPEPPVEETPSPEPPVYEPEMCPTCGGSGLGAGTATPAPRGRRVTDI